MDGTTEARGRAADGAVDSYNVAAATSSKGRRLCSATSFSRADTYRRQASRQKRSGNDFYPRNLQPYSKLSSNCAISQTIPKLRIEVPRAILDFVTTSTEAASQQNPLADDRVGSSAVFAAAFAARPVYLRKLPTCWTVQVGGVEPNRPCAAAASHPGSQVQGSPLGQPIKTSMSRDRCRSGCDRSCPAAVVISRECKILHSRL